MVALDAAKKTATDDAGNVYTYEKLLLATGGSVRRLPDADESVIYFRTAVDYNKLRWLSERGSDFVVIGGGFIGSEVAAALAMNGKRVTHDLSVQRDRVACLSAGARGVPECLLSRRRA